MILRPLIRQWKILHQSRKVDEVPFRYPGNSSSQVFFAATSEPAKLHPQPPCAKHHVPQKFMEPILNVSFLGVPGWFVSGLCSTYEWIKSRETSQIWKATPMLHVRQLRNSMTIAPSLLLLTGCVCDYVCVCGSEFQFYLVGGFCPCKTSSNWESSPSRD